MNTSITLLLVEDDETLRALLEEALVDGGFEISAVTSGQAALAYLDQQSTSLRALITDVNLGDGPDGWEIARHARELSADIPVVYMSGASAHEWTSHGVPNSIIVQKPFAVAQIITAISALINSRDAHY